MMPISRSVPVSPATTKKNNQGGFSLLELMLAVSLGAMMMGMAVALFNPSNVRSYRQSLQELAKVSRHLFKESSAQRSEFWLIVDFRDNRWYVEKPEIDYVAGTVERVRYTDSRVEEEYKLPGDLRFVDVQTASEGSNSIGQSEIVYFSSGYIDPAMIHLRDEEDRKLAWSMMIQPLSGFVDIEEGYVELARQE